MPRVSRKARADNNQAAIVKALRSMGATFQHTHSISGALDGIVGYAGIDQRVEIKDPDKPPSKRHLTDEEKKVFDYWRGRKPVIIETFEDCVALLSIMRQESVSKAAQAAYRDDN